MVSRHEAQPPSSHQWRVENRDVDPARPHLCEERSRSPHATDPVHEQPHIDATSSGGRERIAEPLADLIPAGNLRLDRDGIPSADE